MVSPIQEPGFLTRIVNRIREATQDVIQGDGDAVPAESSPDAIRAQKRRDDAIRRREFNHLRLVRAQRLQSHPEMAVRLSAFQNSSTFNSDGRSLRGRAKTVKKIDAIEAELAQQWWANSNSEAAPTQLPVDPSMESFEIPVGIAVESEMDLDFTGIGYDAATPAAAPEQATAPLTLPPEFVPTLPMGDALGAALDLFEQGQYDQAEAALIALLQSPHLDDQTAEACSATLLNLYRATGDRTSFDTVAIEYAQLFGRSAPEWRTTTLADPVDSLLPPDNSGNLHKLWECPAVLGPVDMVALKALSNSANVTVFDWSSLEAVEPHAVQTLCDVFSHWVAQNVRLHFKGIAQLQSALAGGTTLNDHDVDPLWWRLRLEGLRVLGLQAAFDDAAVDFCVTYEISPPAWAAARCSVVES